MIKVKHKGLKVSASAYRNALRDGLKAAGLQFKQKMLPVRFTNQGAKLLNYTPRSGEPGSETKWAGSYTWRKIRRHENSDGVRSIGERKPFVWSGRTRQLSRNSSRVEAKSQGRGRGHFKVVFPSQTLNFHPELRAEFEKVAGSELATLAKTLTRWTDRSLDRRLKAR